MSRVNRVLDLFKRGDTINKVDEVQPPPKYPFGDLIIRNDDEIRASTAAYRKSLETDNDITAQMSGVVRTKEKEKLLDDIKIDSSSPVDLEVNVSKGLMSKPTEDLVPIMPVNQASLVDRGFDYKAGGEYVNPINKEILTNKNASSINIKIDPTMGIKGGRPQASMKAGGFDTDTVGSSGSAIKVNLIKPTSKGNKGKGWNFVSKNDDIEDTNTLIAVTQGNKHYYTLETDFSKGGNLKTYPNSKDEQRLRPTVNGKLEFGEIIGKIKMGKKDDAPVHNLYRKITTYSGGGFVSRR